MSRKEHRTKLPAGKIPLEILEKVIFRNLGAKRKEVILGPSAGIDGAVIEIGDNELIVSMDPVTGAVERIGWLAINVNANDVATFGVAPAFVFTCILLPDGADKAILETISRQMNEAASKLGIAIVGGHCEVTPGLTSPAVIGCVMGIAKKDEYITAGDAKLGDKLILTKSAGIEGTAILATDREQELCKSLGQEVLGEAKKMFLETSVVRDAATAFKTGGVHAMHDPTEGGVLGGVYEMAQASKLGVRIFKEKIHLRKETVEISRYFKIDPLHLVSSGALLVAVEPAKANHVVSALREGGVITEIIGEFVRDENERVLISKTGRVMRLTEPGTDHLWIALSRKNPYPSGP